MRYDRRIRPVGRDDEFVDRRDRFDALREIVREPLHFGGWGDSLYSTATDEALRIAEREYDEREHRLASADAWFGPRADGWRSLARRAACGCDRAGHRHARIG